MRFMSNVSKISRNFQKPVMSALPIVPAIPWKACLFSYIIPAKKIVWILSDSGRSSTMHGVAQHISFVNLVVLLVGMNKPLIRLRLFKLNFLWGHHLHWSFLCSISDMQESVLILHCRHTLVALPYRAWLLTQCVCFLKKSFHIITQFGHAYSRLILIYSSNNLFRISNRRNNAITKVLQFFFCFISRYSIHKKFIFELIYIVFPK